MLAPVGSSDHDSVLFKLFMPDNGSNDEYVPNGNFALVYDYDNTDYDSLNLYLNSIRWSDVFSCIYSPNECWNVFISILNYGISIYTPMRRASMSYRCAKKYPLYIRQLLRKESVAWRRYKHFKSAQLKSLSLIHISEPTRPY